MQSRSNHFQLFTRVTFILLPFAHIFFLFIFVCFAFAQSLKSREHLLCTLWMGIEWDRQRASERRKKMSRKINSSNNKWSNGFSKTVRRAHHPNPVQLHTQTHTQPKIRLLRQNNNNFYALKDSRVFTAIIFYILIKPHFSCFFSFSFFRFFKISTAAIGAQRPTINYTM